MPDELFICDTGEIFEAIAETRFCVSLMQDMVTLSFQTIRRKAGITRRCEVSHQPRLNDEKAVKAFAARWGELLAKGKAKSLNLQVWHGQVDLFGEYISPELELRDRLRGAWRHIKRPFNMCTTRSRAI